MRGLAILALAAACVAACVAGGCQPEPAPTGAPGPPPALVAAPDPDGTRWESSATAQAVVLRWTDGASQSLRLSCQKAGRLLVVSAAAAAPAPPPPGARATVTIGATAFAGPLTPAAADSETLAIALPISAEVFAALRAADAGVRLSFGQVGVSSGPDPNKNLSSFAAACQALLAVQAAPPERKSP